jgi:DNA-binding response OmpR family regulator
MNILAVDDSDTFQVALNIMLKDLGYTSIVLKKSALEALEYLQQMSSAAAGPGIDIILMDLVMPGMDGLEALKLLKAHATFKDIPVVMISASGEEKKVVEAFEAGAVDFITKPVKKLELLARIRSVLRLKAEIDARKAREKELEKTVDELQISMDQVDTLSGLLPICAFCKQIRDDQGYWQQVEKYVSKHSSASFSHSICPDCLRKHYPKQAEKLLKEFDQEEGSRPGS